MAAFPNSLNPISSDESSLNTSLLTAFAQEEEELDGESDEEIMEDANDAIADAQEEINKAQKKIDESADEGKETTLAQDQLDEAILKLEMAQASFDSGNFEEAEELADEAEDLASESRGKLIGKTEAELEDDGEDFREETDDEDSEDESEIEIEVEIEDGTAKIEAEFGDEELEFEIEWIDEQTTIDEIAFMTGLSIEEIEESITFDFDEVEDEVKDDEDEKEDEIEIEVEVKGDVAKVKVKFDGDKHKFLVTDVSSQSAIADAILNELPLLPLDRDEIIGMWEFEEEEVENEIEIEVEVKGDVAKVKVKFDGDKHKFLVTDVSSQSVIADAILNELPLLPLDRDEIIGMWEFEEEEVDESTLLTTTEFDAYESQQESQELYDDLLQQITELEDRIQALLEKYESGEYYGNVPEVDSEIMSYTISFTGSAISQDDDSVSSMEGKIFIDSLMTNTSISKYTVTGGEISIDDVFYDFVFGKVRVSSSGNIMLIGQVMNWVDENDDSSTIKLVIQSDVALEGGFGSESLNIEILPQSKIANQWHLSGLGTLS